MSIISDKKKQEVYSIIRRIANEYGGINDNNADNLIVRWVESILLSDMYRNDNQIDKIKAINFVIDCLDDIFANVNFEEDTRTVIQVIVNGSVGYIANTSCLHPKPVVVSYFDATDYTDQPKLLEKELYELVTPFDDCFAKSGLRVDHLPVVITYDQSGKVLDSYIGRMPMKYKEKYENN